MNRVLRFAKGSHCVVLAFALSASGCSNAREIPADWKAECVGRMQLSFPGEVEVAANSAKMLEAEYKKRSAQPRFEFPDGEYAGWSLLQVPEWIFVSPPLTTNERDRLEIAAKQDKERVKEWVRTESGKGASQKEFFESLDLNSRRGSASRVGSAYDVSLFVGDVMIRTWSGKDKDWGEHRKDFGKFLSGTSSRKLSEIPIHSGVCLPYAFLRDEENTRRYIATTYRLRQHPDVTVLLKDVTAVVADPKANPAVYDPESGSDSFWGRYDNTYRKSLSSEWYRPYKRITLSNSKGVESFVKIVREDGAVDYGYLVVARGDPHAKEDTPDLMLYVIQNSKNAKAKGIEPVSKEAFLQLAQTIAASVKRRPITAQ